jgi:hypothetical protein
MPRKNKSYQVRSGHNSFVVRHRVQKPNRLISVCMALVYLSFSQHTFAMGSTVKNSVPILNINQGEWIKADVATIMKKIFGGIEAKDRNFPMPKGVADSLGLHPKSYMRVTDILTTKDDKQLLKVQFITIGKSGEEVVGQGWVIPGLAMGEDANHTIIAKDGRDGPQGTTVGPDLETVSGKIGVMLDAKKLSSVLAGATSLRDTLELGAPSLWDFSLSDAATQVQSIVRISLDLFVPGTILNAVLGSLGNLSDHDRELNLTKESLVEGLGRVGEAMDAIKKDMGQLTTQALQLANHGKIMNQLFKTAGLDGEVTRSAVEAFTQISGLKNISARMMSLENDVLEWGFEMDSIQTMGDAKKAAQSLNAIKKELSSLKEMISTGTRVLDKRIQLTFEVEKSLVEMIKNPEKSIEGNRKLIDLFRIHQGGKVLPEPIYQRFKTGLILGMVNQNGGLAERTERELLAADMDTLLAMRDDIKSIGEGGIKGDLIDNPTGWQVLGQVGVGFTPAGMAADARDVAANAGKVWDSGGKENKLMLAMSAVGFVPGFGDAAKMMVKSRLSRTATKELDDASLVVGKLLAEAPSAFKNTDELVSALKAEGLMVDGFKASMKGGLVVLEMTPDVGATLAKNPKQLQSLAQFAEAKGIGRISLKVTSPEAKKVLASFESTGALGRETLVRLLVETADEVKVAKGARDVAWKEFLSKKADTAKAKTAFNDTADALASGKNNLRGLEQYMEQINDLTKSFNKGEVSADEFTRRVEGIMGEAGFERQGDTFVTRGSIEVDPGNKTELRDSGGTMGRDGRTLQEVSGNQPSGSGPDRRIAETGEGVWQGNKEGRKRAQEYAAAGGREAAAGGALSSEIRRVRFKNERLEGKLGDLRTRQGEAVGREETARRRSVDAGTRVRERIQDVNYVGARLAAVSKIENSFALRVEVNVDWTKGDVQVKDVFDTLRNETASKGVSHNWLGGLDPFTAHPGVTKPAVGMVKATTAEIGENAGEIIIYSARDSLSAAENYRSVDRTRLASNARGNRFWAALYGAEDRVTAASEVMGKKGAPDPTHFNVYRLDLSKARVLDLTDPAVAKSFGYEKLGSVADKTKAYPVSQDVAQKARLLGYDVIKVPSVKTGKSNWDVLDNFETLVKEVKTRPGIEAATPDVVSQAKAIVFPPAPSTAESTKNLLMLGGGSLLMGGFGKNTHAKGEESKIASPEVRAAQTMGTLGIGTVVNSLRGVDLGAATSKTLDAGARVWDITKAIGTKIWDNAKSFTQDAGIIMSHTWNSSPSQDEIKPTFIPSAEVQAPLPTLNLMEFSPAKATPPTDSFDTLFNSNASTTKSPIETPATSKTQPDFSENKIFPSSRHEDSLVPTGKTEFEEGISNPQSLSAGSAPSTPAQKGLISKTLNATKSVLGAIFSTAAFLAVMVVNMVVSIPAALVSLSQHGRSQAKVPEGTLSGAEARAQAGVTVTVPPDWKSNVSAFFTRSKELGAEVVERTQNLLNGDGFKTDRQALVARLQSNEVPAKVEQVTNNDKMTQAPNKGLALEFRKEINNLKNVEFNDDGKGAAQKALNDLATQLKQKISEAQTQVKTHRAMEQDYTKQAKIAAKSNNLEGAQRFLTLANGSRAAQAELKSDIQTWRAEGIKATRQASTLKWEIDSAKKRFDAAHTWMNKTDLTNDQKANAISKQLCFVVSYYAYGVASGQESRTITDFYRDEYSKGNIALGSQAPNVGAGRAQWESQYHLQTRSDITTARQDLNASGARVAITWQDNDKEKDGLPDHFFLIFKSDDGQWTNMDHTRRAPEWRGGLTEWTRVYRISFLDDK